MSDHYDTLGIADRQCSADDVKQAFRRAAKEAHPDRAGGSDERMTAVNRAYAVLGDAKARADYDATGADPAPPGQTLRDKGRETLMTNFNNALDLGMPDAGILGALREGFEISLRQLRGAQPKLLRQRDTAAKRATRLKVKQGENFLGVVLARRLAAAEAGLAGNQETIAIVEEAMRQLADYEMAADPAEPGHDPREEDLPRVPEAAGLDELDAALHQFFGRPFTGRGFR